jgi:ankyrin repeat protein
MDGTRQLSVVSAGAVLFTERLYQQYNASTTALWQSVNHWTRKRLISCAPSCTCTVGVMHMPRCVAVVLLMTIALPGSRQQLFERVFGVDADDGMEVPLQMDDEDEQIEQVVEQMTKQIKETVRAQVSAARSGSKLAQSRVIPMSELHMAAANNQYEVVEKLLGKDADPNVKSTMQMTPLHSAADGGYKDIVNLLLAYNATVDAPGPHGVTPLHLAAHRGRTSVVELLLREGAPVDAQMEAAFAFTPLYMAADMGHTRVVSLLLEANCSTDLRAHNGGTALHVATMNGHEGVVRALLEAGADVDSRDSDGLRPVLIASGMQKGELVSLFEEFGAANVTHEEAASMEGKTFLRAELKPFMRIA